MSNPYSSNKPDNQLMILLFKKIAVCLGIGIILFRIFMNSLEMNISILNRYSMLMNLFFIFVNLISFFIPLEYFFKYNVIFKFLTLLTIVISSFSFYIWLKLVHLNFVFLSFLISFFLIVLIILSATQNEKPLYVEEAVRLIRFVCFCSMSNCFSLLIVMLSKILYILCLFVIGRFYCYLTYSFSNNGYSDIIDPASDFLLYQILCIFLSIHINLNEILGCLIF